MNNRVFALVAIMLSSFAFVQPFEVKSEACISIPTGRRVTRRVPVSHIKITLLSSSGFQCAFDGQDNYCNTAYAVLVDRFLRPVERTGKKLFNASGYLGRSGKSNLDFECNDIVDTNSGVVLTYTDTYELSEQIKNFAKWIILSPVDSTGNKEPLKDSLAGCLYGADKISDDSKVYADGVFVTRVVIGLPSERVGEFSSENVVSAAVQTVIDYASSNPTSAIEEIVFLFHQQRAFDACKEALEKLV